MDKQNNRIEIRKIQPEDGERLLQIYAPYVTDTAITFEYVIPSVEEFQKRIQQTIKKYPYLAAEMDGRIVGYAYAGSFVGRAAYDWSVESSIYIDRDCRKNGIGGILYRALERELRKMHVQNINACIGVPAENSGRDEHLDRNSMEFHEHMGFSLVGRFHDSGYKFDTWYDMIWMEKMIGDHQTMPEEIIPWPMLNSADQD